MKNIAFFIACFAYLNLYAQTPNAFNYQGLVKDSNNAILSNTNIGLEIKIIEDSANGTTIYTEEHNTTTNAQGVFSVAIGTGTTIDNFSNINWSSKPHWLQTSIDSSGGTTYVMLGSTQLLSVPYALTAKNVENADLDWTISGNNIQNANTGNVGIGSPASTAKLEVLQSGNSTALSVFHDGTNGSGLTLVNNDASNTSATQQITTLGMGGSLNIFQTNTNNASAAAFIGNDGIGRGLVLQNTNANNVNPVTQITNDGLGSSLQITNTNTNSTSTVTQITNDGLGRSLNIANAAPNNTDIALAVFHNGLGIASIVNITNALNNNPAQAISNEGSGPGSIILNSNTVNSSPALQLENNGIGHTLQVNRNNPVSTDPVMFLTNNSETNTLYAEGHLDGTASSQSVGHFEVISTVNGVNKIGLIGKSNHGLGYGIGVQGEGGVVGLLGINTNNQFAVFGNGNTGATGTKSFVIDHPLDPENKTLRHYSIESNEVMNMYSGNAELDNTGNALIKLPAYFDQINTNFRYQLTAIGTPEHPYISKEISNNQFTISGKPNSKVSWVIYANRNDKHMQQYGKSLTDEIEKTTNTKGKYYNPEYYNQPKTKRIN